MIIIDVPEAKKTLYLPEELSECDPKQFADMAKLIYMFNLGEINYNDFCNLSVYALLGLAAPKKEKEEDSSKWENIFMLSEKIKSFFDTEEKDGKNYLVLKNYDITNKLKLYKFVKNYYGPEDGFFDVTYGQYSDGLEEFITFSQTGDIKSLQLLFAIFYRKKTHTGAFEKYSLETAKKRAKQIFVHTDIRHLYGFYLLFDAFQKYTTSGSITVFGEEIDLSIIYEDVGTKSVIPGIGIHGIVNDLAETGIFGNADGVRETNFWRVALQLYNVKKKSIDQQNEMKKNGTT